MCVGRLRGVCGVCVGGVCGMCVGGACGVCVLGGLGVCGGGFGRVWRGRGSVREGKYRSPLYYPDTLVNPDTCLGTQIVLLKGCVIRKKNETKFTEDKTPSKLRI